LGSCVRDEDFERLYEEHAAALFGFLTYRTGQRALAEDLVAETFARALRGRKGFDRRRGTEKAWLYTIALNLLRDHQRRAGVEERALERSHEERADRALEQAEARDAVQRGLGALSDEERDTVALRFGADLTVPEIAKLTGEKLTTVEGRLYRALRKLREAM
jgi:RNA polymerase sigma-70 factor (ECF subfamily)